MPRLGMARGYTKRSGCLFLTLHHYLHHQLTTPAELSQLSSLSFPLIDRSSTLPFETLFSYIFRSLDITALLLLHSYCRYLLSTLYSILFPFYPPLLLAMPHKINDSNSTLASRGSSADQVIATEVRGMSNVDPMPGQLQTAAKLPLCPQSPNSVQLMRVQPLPSANPRSSSITRAARSTTRPGHPTGTNNAGNKPMPSYAVRSTPYQQCGGGRGIDTLLANAPTLSARLVPTAG